MPLAAAAWETKFAAAATATTFYLIGSYSYRFDAGRTHIDAIQQYCNQHLEERESGVHVKLLMSCFCEKVSQMVSLAELIAYVDHVIAQKQLEEEKQLASLEEHEHAPAKRSTAVPRKTGTSQIWHR